jgi:hypothetical protein
LSRIISSGDRLEPKTSLIIYAVVFIIILALLYKFFKFAFKIVLALSLISAVIMGAIGFFVIKDVMDMKNNLPNSDNLFMFHSEEEILIAFNAQFSGEYMPQTVSQSQLVVLNNLYKDQKFDEILGDNYKTFIFDIDSFNTEGEIEVFKDQFFGKEFLIELVKSDNTVSRLVDEMMVQQDMDSSLKDSLIEQITNSIGEDQKLKASVVFILFFEEIQNDPLFLFNRYKNGDLMIYPRTATFKFINAIPISMLKNAFSLAKDKLNDKVNDQTE